MVLRVTYPTEPDDGGWPSGPQESPTGGYGYPPVGPYNAPAPFPAANSYPPAGPYPHDYPPQYGYAYPPMPPGNNGLAIASLVTSLCGFLCFLPGIVGLVLGIIALNRIKETGEQGRGMAIAGIAIGGVFSAVVVLYIVVLIATGFG